MTAEIETVLCISLLLLAPRILLNGNPYCKKDCNVFGDKKTPGHSYSLVYDKVMDRFPNKSFSMSTFSRCRDNCKFDLDCEMAEYQMNSMICNIYYTFTKNYTMHNYYWLYIWHFCDLRKGPYIKEGVPGFWFYKENYKLIPNLTTVPWPECRELCLNNKLCGGFNLNKGKRRCELLELWENSREDQYIQDYVYTTYFWFVEEGYEYRVENEECRDIEGKPCTGKWEKSEKSESFYLIASFRTRNFSLCYKACEFYVTCEGVTFYPRKSVCELRSVVQGGCSVRRNSPRKEGIRVRWTCCGKRSERQDSTNKIVRVNDGVCRKITHPSLVAIVPLRCTSPSLSSSESCETINKKETIDCFRNQSFLSSEVLFQGFLKVFNGYQTFLVRNASQETFPRSSLASCQLYNASIPKNPRVRVTSFQEWYPIRSYEDNERLGPALKYAIVGTLPHSDCLCYEWIHCVQILRRIQNNESIPFNFLLSAKGDVFENRGWFNRSKTLKMKDQYLYLGFLGDFSTNDPSLESLDSFRNLLALGVALGHLDREYTLLTDFDYKMPGSEDHPSLYNIIRTLPRYNGSVRAHCEGISSWNIVLNSASLVLMVLLLAIFGNLIFRFTHSNLCNFFREKLVRCEICDVELFSMTWETIAYFKYTSDFKVPVINNTTHVTISSTSFFWINVTGTSAATCSKNREKIQNMLRLYRIKDKLFGTDFLVSDSGCGDHQNVCLILGTQSFLCRYIVIILHLEKENLNTDVRNLIYSIISRKCLCVRYNLYHLSTRWNISSIIKV